MLRATLVLLLALASAAAAQTKAETRVYPAHDATIKLVEQIKRADYEGDRGP